MGTIKGGILGGFSGKVGNVIGSSWNGIPYMKAVPENVANPRTEEQMSQRNKFSLVGKFLKTMSPLIKIGYKNLAINQTAFNAAMSYHLRHSVKEVGDDYALDFEKVMISRGPLGGLVIESIDFINDDRINMIQINWSWTEKILENSKASDEVLFLVYHPERKISAYFPRACRRGADVLKFNYPLSWRGDTVHIYIGLVSEDGLLVSDSQYLGEYIVPAAAAGE